MSAIDEVELFDYIPGNELNTSFVANQLDALTVESIRLHLFHPMKANMFVQLKLHNLQMSISYCSYRIAEHE